MSKNKSFKSKYEKCGVKYDIGIGILTKNPTECTERDLKFYNPKQWIWYDDYWYLVKNGKCSKELIEKDCYCKDHVIERILSFI